MELVEDFCQAVAVAERRGQQVEARLARATSSSTTYAGGRRPSTVIRQRGPLGMQCSFVRSISITDRAVYQEAAQPILVALLPSAQQHVTAEQRVCIRKVAETIICFQVTFS